MYIRRTRGGHATRNIHSYFAKGEKRGGTDKEQGLLQDEEERILIAPGGNRLLNQIGEEGRKKKGKSYFDIS